MLVDDDIRILVGTARERCSGWADEVLERRDSAILLLGFAGAYRRSELSQMVCGDVTVHRHDGLHVRLRKSKTDQEGRGAVKALPYTDSHETCPSCAYVRRIQVVAAFDVGGRPSVIRLLRKRTLFGRHVCRGGVPRTAARAPIPRAVAKNGNLGGTPLFGAAIHQTIRRRAEHAGYDPTALAKPGGHSLRAGFVTQGTRNGADGSAMPARPAAPASTRSRSPAANMRPFSATSSMRPGCSGLVGSKPYGVLVVHKISIYHPHSSSTAAAACVSELDQRTHDDR